MTTMTPDEQPLTEDAAWLTARDVLNVRVGLAAGGLMNSGANWQERYRADVDTALRRIEALESAIRASRPPLDEPRCAICRAVLVVQDEVWAGFDAAGRAASRAAFVKARGEEEARANDARKGTLVCPKGHTAASHPPLTDSPAVDDWKRRAEAAEARLETMLCGRCGGMGTFGDTSLGRGAGGQLITNCPTCAGTGGVSWMRLEAAEKVVEAARFILHMDAAQPGADELRVALAEYDARMLNGSTGSERNGEGLPSSP